MIFVLGEIIKEVSTHLDYNSRLFKTPKHQHNDSECTEPGTRRRAHLLRGIRGGCGDTPIVTIALAPNTTTGNDVLK